MTKDLSEIKMRNKALSKKLVRAAVEYCNKNGLDSTKLNDLGFYYFGDVGTLAKGTELSAEELKKYPLDDPATRPKEVLAYTWDTGEFELTDFGKEYLTKEK